MAGIFVSLIGALVVASGANASTAATPRPPIINHWIPYPAKRRRQMGAYSKRHYGVWSDRLSPRVIVEHWTQTTTARPVFDEFSADVPDIELHELPGLCAHFVIDRNGKIFQLVPLNLMCRHTVGLNDHAIGIEHVGMSDSDVMNNHAQITASIRLTRWLRCRYKIAVSNVIGHNESLRSPFHHELIASLRNQTHDDMRPSTMRRYRQIVARKTCAAA